MSGIESRAEESVTVPPRQATWPAQQMARRGIKSARGVTTKGSFDTLHPTLAGVVALLDPLGIGYSVRYLILTWPDGEGGFHVALHQPDGTLAYYGHAHQELLGGDEGFPLFTAAQPVCDAVALNVIATSSGVTLTADPVATTEIVDDRLVPDAG
jgi:hypothetical protein